MNGAKSETNGSGGVGGRKGSNGGCGGVGGGGEEGRVQWKVGLLNHQGRYLTAESFGSKINASGSAMRKKQIWFIEQDKTDDDTVYIRSHLGRYLSGDKRGNVTCSVEGEEGEEGQALGEGEKFSIQYHTDGSGRWAIRNKGTGYYFGGTEDQLMCYEKQPGKTEWWTVHLTIHPQVNIRSNNRQKYAMLNDVDNRLEVTALIPWGQRSHVTLEFYEGRYCLKTSDDRYLHRDGSLVSTPSPDTAFAIELKSGLLSGLAFKDSTGKYLTAVGREAVIQARNKTVGKDELFTIEETHPQVTIRAHNGKMVSYKQGVDLTANKDDEVSDQEIFQVEFDKMTAQWRVRTAEDKYWSLEAASGIQAIGNGRNMKGLFSIEWLEGGFAALQASNGRYVTARMNGSLYAVSDEISDKERFRLTLLNKSRLILRCEFGFVGLKSNVSSRLDCSRASYDVIELSHRDDVDNNSTNVYYLKSHNSRYLNVDAEGNISADSSGPVPFILEFRGQSRLVIKTSMVAGSDQYVCGEQNGQMTVKRCELDKATLWEY